MYRHHQWGRPAYDIMRDKWRLSDKYRKAHPSTESISLLRWTTLYRHAHPPLSYRPPSDRWMTIEERDERRRADEASLCFHGVNRCDP